MTDRNTGIASTAFPVTNTTVTTNSDGSITLVYDVSAAMVTLGQADGVLQGGLITTTNFGATTGALQFRTTVRDLYRAPGPPNGPIQPSDTANNTVTIGASIRNNATITTTTGYQTDASAAGVSIQPGQLVKSIYAINGNTTLATPVTVKPDDAVTYRLRYDIPIGDFSVLRIYDYLPLPIFGAAASIFSPTSEFSTTAPAIGEWTYGPTSAASAARLPAGAGVTVTINSTANSIAWDFGGRSDVSNSPTTLDLLFTVRASNAPMADGLYVTNQARTQQINSVGMQTIADNIVQIQIREPSLAVRKGVIGVYNGPGNAAPDDPAPAVRYDLSRTLPFSVAYSPGNICTARFNTTITSTMLAETPRPFNANASFADAGDRATFAIVLENIGSAPAYGVTFSDTLPAGYDYVPGSLCMQTGGGALIDTTTLTPTALLGGSVTIAGAIAEGRARGSAALTNTAGSNIVIVTYDAIVDTTTGPNTTLLNTTSILSYTNSANGENMLTFTPLADRTDSASVTTNQPNMAKSLDSTEISATNNSLAGQAAIGELITYTIHITAPEGAISNLVITDALASNSGLAFVDCVGVTASPSLTSTIGAFGAACADGASGGSNPLIANNGRSAVWDLGTVINSDTDNGVTETITIQYVAVVRDIVGIVNGGTIVNRVSASYGEAITTTTTIPQFNGPSVSVVEPSLAQSKSNTPGAGDAGDTITYTLIVTNAAGRAPAYNVVVTDSFPAKLTFSPGSIQATPEFSVISSTGMLTATFSVIQPGASARITFTGVLSESVNPTEVIANRAGATGTSLPGLATTARSSYDTISSTERISNSSNSAYLTTAQSSVTAPAVTLGKALVSTEINTTGNTDAQATIGELITYTLLITVPEGASTNVRITDTMASGNRLAFVDCVDISAPAAVASSIGSLSNACLDGATGTDNPVVSNNGRTVGWNLGTLTNSDTNNAVTETVRITYTAVVRNIAGNVNAATLTNRASGSYGASNTLAQVSAANITVVEQDLTQSKANSPVTGDAGDTITYTIVVTNASGRAPAYDVVITDVFLSKFAYNAGSFVSTPDSSVISTSASLTATFAVITPGVTARITVTGILNVAVIPNEVITNTTGVSGTSMPGLAGSNRSTYDPPNTAERTLNSSNSAYAAAAGSPATISAPAIAKTLIDSEINNSVNGATQAVIGEKLTYRLVLNAPEGAMSNARITDTLPAGLTYVTCNSIDAAAEITTSVVGGFSGVCNGTTAPAVSNPGQSIVFDFGTLVNSADSNSVTEQVTITYDAIVLNIAGNQTGTLLNNSAQYGWNGRTLSAVNAGNVRVIEPLMGVLKTVSPAQPTTTDAGDTITYTVVITGPSGADGYDVRLYDALPKTVAGSLILSPTVVSAVAAPNSPAIGASDFAIGGDNDSGWVLTTASSLDLPASISRRITVTLAGVLPSYVAPGSTFTNTAVLSYTTIDGVVSGVARSTFNANSTERDGAGGINDYATNNSAALNVTQVIPHKLIMATSERATATGVDGNPRVAIGEVIQYRVFIMMSEGTAATFSIKDNLPTGLSYVSGSARVGFVASYGAGAGVTSTAITPADAGCGALNITAGDIASVPSSSITCPAPAGRISLDGGNNPTFDFGTVANFDTDADNEYLVVELQAVAQNSAGNSAGTQRANTATTTVNGQSLGATSPVTVTVAEPSLTTRKSVSAPLPLDAGDIVTFTIVYTNGSGANVSPAFDAVITDVLDANLTLDSVTLSAPAPAVDYSSASNTIVTDSGRLTVTVAQLDPGGVVTVTAFARVIADVAAGRRITNTGYLAYTSLPTDTGTINGSFLGSPGIAGSGTGERTGTGGVNSHAANSSVTLTATTPTLVKTTGSPSQYTIGAPIYYSLTVTLPEGVAANVSVLDDFPTGLTYVSSQLITSTAASDGLLSADYDGTIVGPVVTQPAGDVLFAFGDITTTADNTANNTFVIQVLARIANSPTNQQSGGVPSSKTPHG